MARQSASTSTTPVTTLALVEKQPGKRSGAYALNPRSAYIFFCQANRDRIIEENGFKTNDFGPICRKIAEAFKALQPDDRKIWEERVEEDKVRYEEDLQKGLLPKGKRLAEGEAPPAKKPKVVKANPFLFFIKDNMARVKAEEDPEVPKNDQKALMGKLSRIYKALSAEEKDVYVTKAKVARGVFVKAKEEENAQKLGSLGPAPKKPPSPFFRFWTENRKKVIEVCPELKGKAGSVITSKMASIWNLMSLEEKQPYVEASNEARALFVLELDNYAQRRRIVDGMDEDLP